MKQKKPKVTCLTPLRTNGPIFTDNSMFGGASRNRLMASMYVSDPTTLVHRDLSRFIALAQKVMKLHHCKFSDWSHKLLQRPSVFVLALVFALASASAFAPASTSAIALVLAPWPCLCPCTCPRKILRNLSRNPLRNPCTPIRIRCGIYSGIHRALSIYREI